MMTLDKVAQKMELSFRERDLSPGLSGVSKLNLNGERLFLYLFFLQFCVSGILFAGMGEDRVMSRSLRRIPFYRQ